MSRRNGEPCEGFDSFMAGAVSLNRTKSPDGAACVDVWLSPDGKSSSQGLVDWKTDRSSFKAFVKDVGIRNGRIEIAVSDSESADGVTWREFWEELNKRFSSVRLVQRLSAEYLEDEIPYNVVGIIPTKNGFEFRTELSPDAGFYAPRSMVPSNEWYRRNGKKESLFPSEPVTNWKDWLNGLIEEEYYSGEQASIRLYVPGESPASQTVTLPDGRVGRYRFQSWRMPVTFCVCPVWLELSRDRKTLRIGVVDSVSVGSVPKGSEDQPMKWREFLPLLVSMCRKDHENTIAGVQLVSGMESGWDRWYDVKYLRYVGDGPNGFRFITELNKGMSEDRNAPPQMAPDLKFYEEFGTFDASLGESAEIAALARMLDDCRLD